MSVEDITESIVAHIMLLALDLCLQACKYGESCSTYSWIKTGDNVCLCTTVFYILCNRICKIGSSMLNYKY